MKENAPEENMKVQLLYPRDSRGPGELLAHGEREAHGVRVL